MTTELPPTEALPGLASKIPDVYFDWYARLIPGVIAVAIYLLLVKPTVTIDGWNIFVYGAWGYVLGHVVQPLSSSLVRIIQRTIVLDKRKYQSEEDKFTHAKGKPAQLGHVANIKKAHAEAVGLLSTAILLVLVLFVVYFKVSAHSIVLALIPYLFFATYERTIDRRRKILQMPSN